MNRQHFAVLFGFATLVLCYFGIVPLLPAKPQAAPPPPVRLVVDVTPPIKVTGSTVLYDFTKHNAKDPMLALVTTGNISPAGGTLTGPAYVVYPGDVGTDIPVPGVSAFGSTPGTVRATIGSSRQLLGETKPPGSAQVVVFAIYGQ
jgi:hypothetical protein